MDFVAKLEDFLRDLGAESRKKHPGVKEASERAILRLRTLQNAYASAVRKAASSGAEHPTTSLFQSQDLLHPFLLAANYPNASTKLLEISFKAMRLLMESNAVCPGDGIHMVRVWTIQAHVIMSQYQKTNKSAIKNSSDTATANTNGTGDNSSTHDSLSSTSKHKTSLGSSTASWFGISGLIGGGGGGGGSSSSNSISSTAGAATLAASSAASSAADAASKTIKNAVSSSSGQSGQYSVPSNKELEKTALEILSCLLKLTELLKNESQSIDMWTQSVSLCCLLLDFKKTVQQAAHSTLPQVLGILYQTSDNKKFNLQTWEDLLLLASYGPGKKPPTLSGAFAQCRLDAASAKAPPPPSSEFALELMATILKEKPDLLAMSEKFLSRTMGVTVALLQQVTVKAFNLTKALRVYQWVLVLIQTQSTAVTECRELLQHVMKPIRTATETCRSHSDFEDGFTYVGDLSIPSSGATVPAKSSSRRLSNADISDSQHNNSEKYRSLLPPALLWKSGLAVETLYLLLSHCGQLQSSARAESTSGNDRAFLPLLDKQTIVQVTETLSEYATVGAGCEGHILQLVDVCQRANFSRQSATDHRENSNSDMILRSLTSDEDKHQSQNIVNKPMLFHRAEQLIKLGDVAAMLDEKNSSTTTTTGADKKSSSAFSHDIPVMGETLWVAFHGMLEVTIGILPNAPLETKEALVEGAFAPSLATLQHYLRRVPGSPILTRRILEGYTELANICMPSESPEQRLQRKACLSSLCKLSLPSWGEHNASSFLGNHHVRALICLLRIIHTHYNNILSEWNVVMLTFEELSVLTISSPLLCDQMYHAALAVSAVFGRFAPFSTCFSDKSLLAFIDALASVSCSATRERNLVTSNDKSVLDRVLVSSEPISSGEKDTEEDKGSIGGKLVSSMMGVRASMYGRQSGDGKEQDDMVDVPIAKRTKSTFYEAYRNDFVRRLEATTSSALQPDLVSMLPFGLALLADVAMANSFRYRKCVAPISSHICSFASVAPALRVSVMDTVAMLILFRTCEEKNPMAFEAPASLVYTIPKQHQLLAVEPTKRQPVDVSDATVKSHADVPQTELFAPVCECIRTVKSAVVAETATTMLLGMLEKVGHILSGEVWAVIISAISSLSGDTEERRSTEWSNCCLLGFRCLKLIVDDFLDYLPPLSNTNSMALESLLDCCSSFGRSRHDVNTSLTAIGLVWSIAGPHAGPDAIDSALSKLVELASDTRPEVRNCSVNTLFSCIVGRGSAFSSAQWKSCICSTVFGVYDAVILKVNDSGDDKVDLDGNAVNKSKQRYKVNVHHSRDSAGKQWVLTQSLALQGLCRVLRSFFSLLLDHVDDESSARLGLSDDEYETEYEDDTEGSLTNENSFGANGVAAKPWLVGAWSKILDFAVEAASQQGGRDNLELRYAGVELLVLCAQLSCKAGSEAAVTPARISTNMQVVNGALRDMGSSNVTKAAKTASQRIHSQTTDFYRKTMFNLALERIDCYRQFIEDSEAEDEHPAGGMEATQVQVLQKFVSCLGNLYDCCKENEMSQQGGEGDDLAIQRYFKISKQESGGAEHFFVNCLATVAETATGGPRFLSQAQRAAVDLLRSMAKQGSSEAVLRCVMISGPWLFCRKDEGGNDKTASTADQSGACVVGCEMASIVSKEIMSESISFGCKALALWLSLSVLSSDVFNFDGGGEGRRKAYYKHFLPLLREGLKSSLALQGALSPPRTGHPTEAEIALVVDIWNRLCDALLRMLTPVQDAANLRKISRAPEVVEIVKLSVEFVPPSASDSLCAVLSKGASEAFALEQANRSQEGKENDGETGRRRQKYHDDALSIFKACYAGLCMKKSDDPELLAITDKALSDALAAINDSKAGDTSDGLYLFLMVCQAFEEINGVEELIISSFPYLCKFVQSQHELARNAAAAALGSTDLRQVLSDAKTRYESAERQAKRFESEVKDLSEAIADLQRKNEMLQEQVAMSSLHLT